jgi:hypothetical protein
MPSVAWPLHGNKKASFFIASQITEVICSPIHGFEMSMRGSDVCA